MTYKEWMTKTAAKFQLNADDVELLLCNQSELIPDPSANVDVRTAKKALCLEFATVIPMANIGEGGYSISWNWEAIKFWYNVTCAEVGLVPVGRPRIRNRSDIW